MASDLAMLTVSKSSSLNIIPDPIILHPNSVVTIGRGAKCDMCFPEVKSVSHVHCYVRSHDGVVQVKSVSSNKTMFDSIVLPNNEWHTVRGSGVLLLSSDSKIKIEIRVGDEALNHKKHKHKLHAKSGGIAQVFGVKDPRVHAIVSPKEDGIATLTVGRSKECEIVIDNKKISSLHCTLVVKKLDEIFTLTVRPGESRNKTYLNGDQVEDSMTVELNKSVDVCLVFPGDKAVETLRIVPSAKEDREEKRRKKELRTLEKDDKKWNQTYQEEVNQLVEKESVFLCEIELVELKLTQKKKQVETLKKNLAERKLNSDSSKLIDIKKSHSENFEALTLSLAATVDKLNKLTQEKLDLLMNDDNPMHNSQ